MPGMQMESSAMERPPLLLAITGASGMIYTVKFLEILAALGQEVDMILSEAGELVAELELGKAGTDRLKGFAKVIHDSHDMAAAPASGSGRWRAMVILPCTMGTLAAVANGLSSNLIHRAADCFLKERRPLIVVPRETPLNRNHLRNMMLAHEAGAVIFPAMPSFYHRPSSIDDMADFFSGRLAESIGLSVPGLKRWTGKQNEYDPRS